MTATHQDQGSETPGVRPAGPSTPASSTAGPAASGGTPLSSGTPAAARAEDAATRAKAGVHEARAAGDEAASAARGMSENLKSRARHAVDDVREHARTVAGDQKNFAADRLSGFADALRSASSDLDGQGQSVVSGFVRQAAEGLESVSGAMRSRDVDDLMGSVEDFARRQPVVFLSSAVLAGFGIARFMKSSSERRQERGYDPARPYDPRRRSRPADPGAPYGGTPYEGGL